MIDLAKIDEQLRAAGVPVATVRDANGDGKLEVVLREGASRGDYAATIKAALDAPPTLGPAELLRAAGVDPERAALALVLARREKAPEWARSVVEALAANVEKALG